MKIEIELSDNELDLLIETLEEQQNICFPDQEEPLGNLIKKIQNVIKKKAVAK